MREVDRNSLREQIAHRIAAHDACDRDPDVFNSECREDERERYRGMADVALSMIEAHQPDGSQGCGADRDSLREQIAQRAYDRWMESHDVVGGEYPPSQGNGPSIWVHAADAALSVMRRLLDAKTRESADIRAGWERSRGYLRSAVRERDQARAALNRLDTVATETDLVNCDEDSTLEDRIFHALRHGQLYYIRAAQLQEERDDRLLALKQRVDFSEKHLALSALAAKAARAEVVRLREVNSILVSTYAMQEATLKEAVAQAEENLQAAIETRNAEYGRSSETIGDLRKEVTHYRTNIIAAGWAPTGVNNGDGYLPGVLAVANAPAEENP